MPQAAAGWAGLALGPIRLGHRHLDAHPSNQIDRPADLQSAKSSGESFTTSAC